MIFAQIILMLAIGLAISIVPFWLQTIHHRRQTDEPIQLRLSEDGKDLIDINTGRYLNYYEFKVEAEMCNVMRYHASGYIVDENGMIVVTGPRGKNK